MTLFNISVYKDNSIDLYVMFAIASFFLTILYTIAAEIHFGDMKLENSIRMNQLKKDFPVVDKGKKYIEILFALFISSSISLLFFIYFGCNGSKLFAIIQCICFLLALSLLIKINLDQRNAKWW